MLTDTMIRSVIGVPPEPKNNPRLWFEAQHCLWREGWAVHWPDVKLTVELAIVNGRGYINFEIVNESKDRWMARFRLWAVPEAKLTMTVYPNPLDVFRFRAQRGVEATDDLTCEVRCTTERRIKPLGKLRF
jgi:hypothetical protein